MMIPRCVVSSACVGVTNNALNHLTNEVQYCDIDLPEIFIVPQKIIFMQGNIT